MTWANAPGMRWDWLAVYVPGSSDGSKVVEGCNAGCASNGRYLMYIYTKTAIEGAARIDARRDARDVRLAAQARDVRDPAPRRRQLPTAGSSASFKVVKPRPRRAPLPSITRSLRIPIVAAPIDTVRSRDLAGLSGLVEIGLAKRAIAFEGPRR